MIQNTLPAFSESEVRMVHSLLATRVAYMMGRKFEEGDWADIYCKAKNIANAGWSNLNIDIINNNQGIEHKMLCYRSGVNLLEACGQTFMHPSATRSIRISSSEPSANKAMQSVLEQYSQLILERTKMVYARSDKRAEPDMRTGWLLWQEDLHSFLYFEERMFAPSFDEYYAEWSERPTRGIRKQSKNLWIYEKATGKKRYSVTTDAGAKIQPYFDVPNPKDPNLYHFTVIGEAISDEVVRIWITESTYLNLLTIVGMNVDTNTLSALVLNAKEKISGTDYVDNYVYEKARELALTKEAYIALKDSLPGVNDDHSIRILIDFLRETK